MKRLEDMVALQSLSSPSRRRSHRPSQKGAPYPTAGTVVVLPQPEHAVEDVVK